MKHSALALLLTPLLWACGSAGSPAVQVPEVSAGELLSAPTHLVLDGVDLHAEAQPYLNEIGCASSGCAHLPNFVVPVKLLAPSVRAAKNSPLNTFRVTGVYVVTEGGVWRSGVAASDNRRCTSVAACLQAVSRGNASVASGTPAQVVLTFLDGAGKAHMLRDDDVWVRRLS